MSNRPRSSLKHRAALAAVVVVLVVVSTRAYAAFRALVGSTGSHDPASALTAPESGVDSTHMSDSLLIVLPDSLRGKSAAVRFATLTPAAAVALPGFIQSYGESAIRRPAAHLVRAGEDIFALITLEPFAAKHGEYVGAYRLGMWPAERWMMGRSYYNPDGLVQVTPSNGSLLLSRHFSLGEFVTHDQENVWPKYVVLEPKLIDKLELILQDLTARGYRVEHPVVLSGFRAPYYNERGAAEGMARASRHQYGDAADILIDEDGDGRMDDLNHDGRVDLRDVAPLAAAVYRVDTKYPELVGGLGTYAAMGPRGPFVHVDVRGTSARWENDWWKGRGQ